MSNANESIIQSVKPKYFDPTDYISIPAGPVWFLNCLLVNSELIHSQRVTWGTFISCNPRPASVCQTKSEARRSRTLARSKRLTLPSFFSPLHHPEFTPHISKIPLMGGCRWRNRQRRQFWLNYTIPCPLGAIRKGN